MLLTVYCSGSIKKGPSDRNKVCWTEAECHMVSVGARPHEVRFLNPDDPVNGLGNTRAMFGRDMYQVQTADFVVIDARQHRGIGVGVELALSRLLRTRVIVVAPPNSHYRKDTLDYRGATVQNYVHPHLAHLADAIVDDFSAAGAWMSAHCHDQLEPGTFSAVYEAIEVYRRDVLPNDKAMQEVMGALREDGRTD